MYTVDKEWTQAQNIRKSAGYVQLDLTTLDELSSQFEALSSETKMPAQQIRKRFEDTLLGSGSLKLGISAIILRYESFSERSASCATENLNQYQMLRKKYEGEIQLGVNVPLKEWDSFPNEALKPFLKGVKIIGVNVSSEDINGDGYFARLREFVRKNLVTAAKKADELQTLHLHFNIECAEDLNLIQHQLIRKEFPIEFISISSNLLTKIQGGKINQYLRAYKRYLGCGFNNILDFVESIPPIINQFGGPNELQPLKMIPIIDKVLRFLKDIEYEHKKGRVYLGGIRVSSCLLIPAIRVFRNQLQTDCMVHTAADRYAFAPMRRVFKGDFTGILTTPLEKE